MALLFRSIVFVEILTRKFRENVFALRIGLSELLKRPRFAIEYFLIIHRKLIFGII